MKICIPTLGEKGMDEQVSEHFGSAPYFNQNQHHSHGQCHPMSAISGKGMNGVICGGMGRRAVELLNSDGIKVYLGNGNTVKTVVEEYKQGSLKELTADGACGGDGCH